MTKSYIEKILKSDDMINTIAIARTKFSHNMTYFNFLRIFIDSLQTVDIQLMIEVLPLDAVNTLSEDNVKYETIRFVSSDLSNALSFKYNIFKLNDKIREYNQRLENMGFKESAIFLIDIFLDILEE